MALLHQLSTPKGAPQPEIPIATRARYEKQFTVESKGSPYITGIDAAMIFQGSGLTRADLSQIWELTDTNPDGRFDREVFVQAMWLIELRTGRLGGSSPQPPLDQLTYVPRPQGQWHDQPGPPPPATTTYGLPFEHLPPYQNVHPSNYAAAHQQAQCINSITAPTLEISTAIVCRGCESGLVPEDIVYHCSTCSNHYCQPCHTNREQCPHNPRAITLKLSHKTPLRKNGTTGCDGCWKDIKKGKLTWYCKKCWGKDLCEKCWQKKKRHCTHVGQGSVQMMTVGKCDPDDEDDILETVSEIVGAVVGV